MKRAILFTLIMSLILAPATFANGKGIKITENKAKKQLDVTIDGELFTS